MLVAAKCLDLTVEANNIVRSATVDLSSFALRRVDDTVGPGILLIWLRVSLCRGITSIQEPAFEVRPSPRFGSLCRVILGNMSWISCR